jgi:hypothetical protein
VIGERAPIVRRGGDSPIIRGGAVDGDCGVSGINSNDEERPGFVRVDRPSEAANFGRHLTACGLMPDSESPAMLRGDWPAATAPQRIYALASHALG